MALTESQRHLLFAALEKVGWRTREGFSYAPHETMWLMVSEPWTGDLQDFHDRMVGRLQRIQNLREHHTPQDHQKGVDDVTSLICVLSKMISDEN